MSYDVEGQILMLPNDALKPQPTHTDTQQVTRQAAFGKISRRMLVETYAPAAALINRDYQVLYSLGPVGQYLNQPAGQPVHDLMASAPLHLRPKLRAAIQSVFRDNLPASVSGGSMLRDGATLPYGIDMLPVADKVEPLLLVCFLAGPAQPPAPANGGGNAGTGSGTLLEQQLQAVKAALEGALQDFEISNDEHRAINEEATVMNEEAQVTIEELLSWKSGLETLTKETNELNGQLRGALEVHQSNANILRNILNSIGVAILQLDRDLHIKFFTPEIEPFFRLINTDVGRPLVDFNYLASDDQLEDDCLDVLRTPQPIGREIEVSDGRQFLRHIMPYRHENGEVDGVIITFSELTETKTISAERALHLQSPNTRLHTLQMPPENPGQSVPGEAGEKLQQMIDQTAGTLAVMLNSLREIKQLDAVGQPISDESPAKTYEQRGDASKRIENLTPRERQIMQMVVAGHPSKTIAMELGISQRTVENHRAAIMRKTESRSLPALARVAFASGLNDISEAPAQH